MNAASTRRSFVIFASLSLLGLAQSAFATGVTPNKVLFDATKAQMAGNADWVIDADVHNVGNVGGVMTPGAGSDSNPQRIPNPPQSMITAGTAETFWQGALSSWAVALVKRGFTVETLPIGGRITFGDGTNAQDLSNYGIYVVDEPNIAFTAAEKAAIIAFVNAGGGLFMISDHTGSDRNSDGIDAVGVWNALPATTFGITINADNVSPDSFAVDTTPSDPIIHGAAGNVTEMLYANGATLTISTAQNPSVKAAIWSSTTHTNSNVMVAYATYGLGKVVACGDSSPFDDGTGDPGDTLFHGWDVDAGGNHAILTINACLWLNPTAGCTGPSITTQPSPQTICTGSPVTFTAAASGSPTPTYQWRKNTVNIGGATSASYTIASVAAGDAGNYDCVATNSCSSATTNSVALTVNAAPAITTQPTPKTACPSASVTFTVAASGTPAPTYQWRKNTVNIGGATGTSYTISSVVAGDAANYDCVATNSCSSAASNSVALTVNSAPAITTQPTPKTACPTASVTFTAAASGSPAPTYQWRKNTVNIGGATSASYTIASVAAGDAGNYDCVTTNSCSSATTNSVALTVNSAPGITTQPMPTAVCPGLPATFAVAASGSPAPTYQWRRNTVNIGGATGDSYTIPSVAAGDAANYDCVATNTCSSATTNAVALTVNAAPAITTQPSAQSVCVGTSATFTSAASGSPAPTYQWRKNTVNIPGATSASYTLAPVVAGDAANYDCVATNSCSSATTDAVALTVNSAPAITIQPASQTACAGSSVMFTAGASGSPTPTFQWRKDTINIPGATGASYTIASVTTGDSGAYDCVATNSCSSATTSAASLGVTASQPPFDLFSSGGFEDPALGFPSLVLDASNAGFLTNWQTLPDGVGTPSALVQAPTYPVFDGQQSLTLEAGDAIQTLIAIPPGQTIEVSLTVHGLTTPQSARLSAAAQTLAFDARLDGVATGVDFAPGDPWRRIHWSFMSDPSGTTTFRITNLSPSPTTDPINIDAVRISRGSPISQSTCLGSAATFTVIAPGSGPFIYQWRRAGVALVDGPAGAGFGQVSGSGTDTLTLSSITLADAGPFDCVITGSCGTSTSDDATLAVATATGSLSRQPSSDPICQGQDATLTAATQCANNPTYEWFLDNTLIPNQTQASLVLSGITAAANGDYTCTVTHDAGTLNLGPISITVSAAPSITTQPVGGRICLGATANLAVAANGSGPLGYQWRHAAVALADSAGHIAGSATPNLAVTAQSALDTGGYDCVVTNICGQASTSIVTVFVCVADFNCSSTVTVQDLFDFLKAWFIHDPTADINGVGGVTIQDLFDFLKAYFPGCP